jgi:predicted  nucleic acid-binding Zn-ribbon protein
MNIEDVRHMASTTRNDDESRANRAREFDEDDTLSEVGEEHDFEALEDETDIADRRRDPLRMPH